MPDGSKLLLWHAENGDGAPLCIAGDTDAVRTYAVELYVRNDAIVGVRVTDGTETVSETGLMPVEGD
jgi:hypothetical protein